MDGEGGGEGEVLGWGHEGGDGGQGGGTGEEEVEEEGQGLDVCGWGVSLVGGHCGRWGGAGEVQSSSSK